MRIFCPRCPICAPGRPFQLLWQRFAQLVLVHLLAVVDEEHVLVAVASLQRCARRLGLDDALVVGEDEGLPHDRSAHLGARRFVGVSEVAFAAAAARGGTRALLALRRALELASEDEQIVGEELKVLRRADTMSV
eukprot:3917231-Pleurochrysis_carterae.AAC.4